MDNVTTLDALCAEHGIQITSRRTDNGPPQPPRGDIAREWWQRGPTEWSVTITRSGRKPIVTTYGMGSAHKGAPKRADVVACLILDAQSGRETTFENFCSEFGCSTDSRKARTAYLACVDMNAKIAAFLGTEREAFEAAAAEY